MDFILRKFNNKDFNGVQNVLKLAALSTYMSPDLTEEDILKSFKSQKTSLLPPPKNIWRYVAINNNLIVGVVTAVNNNGVIILKQLYVLPEFQGKGCGTALLEKIHSLSMGAQQIRLEVSISNNRAIKFYSSKGYEKTEIIGEYKIGDKSLPTLLMIKNITKI